MHFVTRNVNTAFNGLVKLFNGDKYAVSDHPGPHIVERPSRNGPVMMIDEPVMVTYTHPRERVLFNPARDANPFLHLYEALWMLAGRNDVAPLAYYTKRFNEYSDDGKTLNGAYGNRWRTAKIQDGDRYNDAEYVDQLDILVNHLKTNPNSRRAVLQMWNVKDDMLEIDSSKDVCCNTAVYFSIRSSLDTNGADYRYDAQRGVDKEVKWLDMTVTNRSNDMIWGMLGANIVHFSFLQEYMAARIGVEVGRYTQMTNNLHVYKNNWKPGEWLNSHLEYIPTHIDDRVSLVKSPTVFGEELPRFVEKFSGKLPAENLADEWKEPFFQDVAQPMLIAFACHKERAYHSAFQGMDLIEDGAWRIAAQEWLERRRDRYESK